MSDTPETDALIAYLECESGCKVEGNDLVVIDFLRQMERERNDMRAELVDLYRERKLSADMFKWWRDRFDDIEDDAKRLREQAPAELHGMIEGIRVVAEQGRDGMDRLANK